MHPPTAVTLYSPSDYWLTWLIKILPFMWQKLTKKVEVWLLFVNLPTCTHPSVAQAGPSWFWSDPVHWYNSLTSYTHLLPNPTSANNLHSHKLQLPRHPPLNQSADMTAIHKSNICHNRLKPTTTRHQPRNPKTAKAENRSSYKQVLGELSRPVSTGSTPGHCAHCCAQRFFLVQFKINPEEREKKKHSSSVHG